VSDYVLMNTCCWFQGPDFEDVAGKSVESSEDDSDDVDDEEDTEDEAELTSSPVHQHRYDIIPSGEFCDL